MQNIRYHVSEPQNISNINQPNDITEINQLKEDMPNINQPKEDIPDINQPKEDIPDINQPKEDIPDINQPKEDIPDINQPKEDIPDINQLKEDIPNINDSPNFDENKFDKLKTEIETVTKDTIEIEDDIRFEGSINILKPITIEGKLKSDGSKPKLIIESNKTSSSPFRHFNATKNLTLKNLYLIVNRQIEDDVELGGIHAEADINIENCNFINNHNEKGGAIYISPFFLTKNNDSKNISPK